MFIKTLPNGSLVHWIHFQEFRNTGISFETRLSKYTKVNRTLSSYVEGEKKGSRKHCEVRGYWGDIALTP